jgi:hypothetical protein
LHFSHNTKASAIDSVFQVEGASFNATKKLQWRLAATEARLIKPVTPRDHEVMLLSTIKFVFTHRPALIALFVASRTRTIPERGCQ